jgi:hypothetical protein
MILRQAKIASFNPADSVLTEPAVWQRSSKLRDLEEPVLGPVLGAPRKCAVIGADVRDQHTIF